MNFDNILDDEAKENLNMVNRMKNYKDPLLEEFDKQNANHSEESGDEEESSSGDEEEQI